ncbi:MAG TPA: hypothetical protein VFU89_03770 [Rhabdochlamydiaceae bacterium]|nr:hypothetical protein [Rhabdochlamydiaceae bacterium]
MNMIAKTALLACVFVASYASGSPIPMKEVNFDIRIVCQDSEELRYLQAALPPPRTQFSSYEVWERVFIANLENIVKLLQSRKFTDARYGGDVKDHISSH